jgi:membrane-associated phospholipid phosphatase
VTSLAAAPAHVRASGRARPLLLGAICLAVAFVPLAIAVAAGWSTRLDQWAIDGTMPWHGGPGGPRVGLLGTAFPIFHRHVENGHVPGRLVAYLVTWPASAGPAAIIAAACLLLLWRQGRRREAIAWGIAFTLGNAIEILCKAVLTRPPLFFHAGGLAVHVDAYDASFPSGHAVRALLLAFIVAAVWPRLLHLLLVWALSVAVLLDLGTYHVPTDIAGSLLLGFALVLCVKAYAPAARIAATEPGS